jgi:hypothetical protein
LKGCGQNNNIKALKKGREIVFVVLIMRMGGMGMIEMYFPRRQ